MPNDRFLSRWSRQKAKTRRPRSNPAAAAGTSDTVAPAEPELASDVIEVETPPTVNPQSDPQDNAELPSDPSVPEQELTDAELSAKAEELGLPALETLGPGSDFKAFMSADVPARLRTLALRKLWLSNPALANLDGLIDYGEDFTDKALVVKNLQTAYQVGRGYKRDPDPEPDEELEESPEDETLEEEELLADETEDEIEDDTDDVAPVETDPPANPKGDA